MGHWVSEMTEEGWAELKKVSQKHVVTESMRNGPERSRTSMIVSPCACICFHMGNTTPHPLGNRSCRLFSRTLAFFA